jgi:tetratricopeptide (TPR) repeat protein
MAFADESETSSSERSPDREYRPVNSIDGIEGPTTDAPGAYARKAEYCLKQGYIEQAIKLSEKAIDLRDDPDLHQILAQALEKKWKAQTERDPALFRRCISEWLIVLRQPGGEEDLSSHGLAIPGMGKLYQDEDRKLPAKRHLIQLTGYCPKVWETDTKFLNRVANLTKQSVNGKVVKADSEEK